VLERLTVAAALAFVVRALNVAWRSAERIDVVLRDDALPFLSIIVPARNEERQIEACVRSLLAQNYPDFEVITVDDRSDDRTREILEQIVQRDSRLLVVHGDPLPKGWVGKPWALAQGAKHARGAWLLFTDADTVHDRRAAVSAVSHAVKTGVHALSLLTTQQFETFAERAVLPTILWMIAFSVGSLDAINDPKRLDAAIFNGQFILFERRAYDALGGHEAVRDCIAEDYEFARILKRDGRFRSRLAEAADLVTTRMYRSFGEIWNGFSKNLYVAAEDAPGWAVAGTVMLASLSPLPETLLVRAVLKRDMPAALRMIAVIAATLAAAEVGMRRARFPRWSGAFFPAGVAAMLGIFLNSTVQHTRGRVSWRGRSYSRPDRTAGADSQT
jgi:chlorobactene glucosyltransferase